MLLKVKSLEYIATITSALPFLQPMKVLQNEATWNDLLQIVDPMEESNNNTDQYIRFVDQNHQMLTLLVNFTKLDAGEILNLRDLQGKLQDSSETVYQAI
jgi:Fe-S-cluster formation regulator IscX/YfhJ